MPIFTKGERAVLFVHVPKTGGTSLERMLIREGWEVGFRATPKTHPTQSRLHRVSPQHFHAELLEQTLRLDRFDAIFLITREPLARFRSEYVMRNKRNANAGSAAHVEAWARRLFRRRAANPSVLDNHLRPQHEFVVPDARIFRLEDGMESIVTALNAEWGLGLPLDIPRNLASGTDGHISSQDVEVNDFVQARVRALYARDYETFGYS